MSWIGVTDHEDGRFSKTGLGPEKTAPCPSPLLERGTLMFETRVAGHQKPHDLFGISHPFPWPRELTFRAIPGGGIAMLHRHHTEVNHAAIRWADDGRTPTLRVTYAWDAPNGWGRLALERPEGNKIISRPVHMPRPLMKDDMRDVILAHPARTLSKEVLFAGISTDVLPVGPMPSLHPATPIATPGGYRPAGSLQRGDTVTTDTGDIVPVLHTVHHVVPARGSFAPVRLRAPYFGLHRDIVVAPEQRLVLKGSEVEYIFGQEAVLVPARHLVNGHAAIWNNTESTTEYVQVILPRHEALVAAGCALESLYIGRIRRDAERLDASVLADIPSRLLPEHARPIHQVLGSFEAITLVDQRAA
ncbi:Hint domain-containing protein [Tateyamaria omphalii]|uniref:Hint domain-containing protein n=1 Tax=Tateyamaria omphalii TaxID=299262 RepID=UPI001C9987EA|nr:Hint domain-containing protein [Tateyamaria omphalii]MBY5933591.1 Hint domain-containing protein [Tateyamaria omphalii]